MRSNKNLNKKKSIIRRMINYIKANNLKMMFFLVIAYFWWQIFNSMNWCFDNFTCFFTGNSLFNIVILGTYTFLGWKMLVLLKSDEKLEKDIKILTKNNLEKNNEIADLQKQKLELEIQNLKKKIKKKPI